MGEGVISDEIVWCCVDLLIWGVESIFFTRRRVPAWSSSSSRFETRVIRFFLNFLLCDWIDRLQHLFKRVICQTYFFARLRTVPNYWMTSNTGLMGNGSYDAGPHNIEVRRIFATKLGAWICKHGTVQFWSKSGARSSQRRRENVGTDHSKYSGLRNAVFLRKSLVSCFAKWEVRLRLLARPILLLCALSGAVLWNTNGLRTIGSLRPLFCPIIQISASRGALRKSLFGDAQAFFVLYTSVGIVALCFLLNVKLYGSADCTLHTEIADKSPETTWAIKLGNFTSSDKFSLVFVSYCLTVDIFFGDMRPPTVHQITVKFFYTILKPAYQPESK